MIDWRTIKLEKVITDIAAGPFGSNLKVECFVESGFPIIDGANLKGFKVTDNITKFVTEEKARSLHRSIAKRNDVIVTISGNVGQIAYIPNDSKYIEYLVSQRQFRVSFDESAIDVPYLVYYFHTREGQHKILSFANQVGVPALAQPLKNFKAIELNLPSLPTQRRIASILSSLDDKIDLLHRENKTLEAMAETLFRQWFIEEAKEDWEEVSLEDIAYLSAGGDKPKNVSYNRTNELNIPIYSNGIENEGLYGYTDIPKITEESVTISARGTIGYVVLRTEPFVPIVRLITLTPKKNITSKYLYFWAKSQDINGTGTTQQQLTIPDFKLTKILLPEKEFISKFTNEVDKYYKKILLNKQQIQTLIQQRDGLLPKLMSGEVKI